jgi:hypothetical protein
MLANIVDRRTNPYDVRCDAVFEDSWHDNTVEGATRFPQEAAGPSCGCDMADDTTLAEAAAQAAAYPGPVTVFLYDVGANAIAYSGEDSRRHGEVVKLRFAVHKAMARAEKEHPLDAAKMREAILAAAEAA